MTSFLPRDQGGSALWLATGKMDRCLSRVAYSAQVRPIAKGKEARGRQLLSNSVHTLDVDVKIPVGRDTLVNAQSCGLRGAGGFRLAIGKGRGQLCAKTAGLVGVFPEDGQQQLILQLAKDAPHPWTPDLQKKWKPLSR